MLLEDEVAGMDRNKVPHAEMCSKLFVQTALNVVIAIYRKSLNFCAENFVSLVFMSSNFSRIDHTCENLARAQASENTSLIELHQTTLEEFERACCI